MPGAKTWIVVPCFDEADRLRGDEFARFTSEHPDVHFLFVDDGSTDGTRAVLEAIPARKGAVSVLALSPNQGKAEAVRRGMCEAFEHGAVYAGYWDADLATPLDEIPRFVETLDAHPGLEVLFGSRVQLLGRHIERSAVRHYLGRVGATAISVVLRLPVYDTQCGAKLFRVTPDCKAIFAEPFVAGWIFDVEIVARLIAARRGSGGPGAAEVIREVPLWEWRDVAGSKVRAGDFLRSLGALWRIRRRYLG
jgi:glycosyltransferase involved in cell wall biosynthesis